MNYYWRTVPLVVLLIAGARALSLVAAHSARPIAAARPTHHTLLGRPAALPYRVRHPAVATPVLAVLDQHAAALGNLDQTFTALARDQHGRIFVTGSAVRPTPTGAAMPITRTVFVAEFSPDSRHLLWSTSVGVNGTSQGRAIAVARNGTVYVAATTDAHDFPTTASALYRTWRPTACPIPDGTPAPCTNGVVLAFTPGHPRPSYSSFAATDGTTDATSIAIAGDGSIYVAGQTTSPYLPTTVGAYQRRASGGGRDGFVMRFSNDHLRLMACTYLGGNGLGTTQINALALDALGRVVVAGAASTADLPPFPHGTTTYSSGADAIVGVMTPPLHRVVGVTYLGGSSDESLSGIAVAGTHVWVTGATASTDFPLTDHSLQASGANPAGPYIARISLTSGAIEHVVALGIGATAPPAGIVLDAVGRLIVAGVTGAGPFPTVNAAQAILKGATDGYVVVLSPDAQHILSSRYLGGLGDDSVSAITQGNDSSVLLVGATTSTDFPAGPAGAPLSQTATTPSGSVAAMAFLATVHLVAPTTPGRVSCSTLAASKQARASLFCSLQTPFAVRTAVFEGRDIIAVGVTQRHAGSLITARVTVAGRERWSTRLPIAALPSAPFHILLDSGASRIAIAGTSGTVALLSSVNGHIVRLIHLGHVATTGPLVVMAAAVHRLCMANGLDDVISCFDTHTGALTRRINDQPTPPAPTTALAANNSDGTLVAMANGYSLVNPVTGSIQGGGGIGGTFGGPPQPIHLAVDSVSGLVAFAMHMPGFTVSFLNSPATFFTLGSNVSLLTVASSHAHVFAADHDSGLVGMLQEPTGDAGGWIVNATTAISSPAAMVTDDRAGYTVVVGLAAGTHQRTMTFLDNVTGEPRRAVVLPSGRLGAGTSLIVSPSAAWLGLIVDEHLLIVRAGSS